MKRLLAITLVIMLSLIAVFSFSVNAEENDFSVTFEGSEYVYPGNTCWFYVSIGKAKTEIRSLSIDIEYDTSFFEFISFELVDISTTVDNWAFSDVSETDGVISINIYDNTITDPSATETNPLTGSLEIVYMLKLETKSDATGTSDIKVTNAEGGTYITPDLKGENTTLTAVAVAPLERPYFTAYEDGVISWNEIKNAVSYEVKIYRSGKLVETVKDVETASLDLNPYFLKYLGGTYTVRVTAVSESPAYSDSMSKESPGYKYKGQLAKPTITLSSDPVNGKVTYTITDTNEDGLVSDYTIRVYEVGGETALYELYGSKGAGQTLGAALEPGKSYEITVEAISGNANIDSGNSSSGESERVSVTVDAISGIAIEALPNLSYTEGDTLDLSGMTVKITYASGKETTVGLADFETYGITVSPKHGADLTLSMDGKKLVVTVGSITTSEDVSIEVESGECKHEGATTKEHLDPTCGVDGYDKTVCSLCGVAIETEVLPATKNHAFGEWEWLYIPTTSIDGIRYHQCSVCGYDETNNVSYEEYQEMQTTPSQSGDNDPGQTSPNGSGNNGGNSGGNNGTGAVTTDPPVNDPIGGLGNIGVIFLIALLIIFFIIVLFIVIAIWSESRTNRRRRSNRRTGSSSKRPPQNRPNGGNGGNRPPRPRA